MLTMAGNTDKSRIVCVSQKGQVLSTMTTPSPDATDCEGETVDDHENTEFDSCETREITLIEIRMIIRLKLSL